MTIVLTWQTIAALVGGLSAIGVLLAWIRKGMDFIDHQHDQDDKIDKLHQRHDADVREIRTEQTLIIYGLLGALKGLQEQGCNGPVSEAIGRIEKHLNQKAHE